MSGPVEALFAAQELLLNRRPQSANAAFVLRELAARVPSTSLAHFLRFVEQGRRGVAIVRNGACSECGTPVPLHVQAALVERPVTPLCRRCECFLLLETTAATLNCRPESGAASRRRASDFRAAPARALAGCRNSAVEADPPG